MKKEISDALINKYLDRKCSENEEVMVEAWYEAIGDPLSTEEVDRLRQNEPLKRRMLKNIRKNSGFVSRDSEERVLRSTQKKRSTRLSGVWLGAAAAIVLVAFTWLFLQRYMEASFHTNGSVLVKNEGRTILRHTLPDGSVLWLAPQASLHYTKAFQLKSREVSMRGDIFFEVAKDPHKPFVINSGTLKTKVLGTSFRIRSANDIGEEVSVVSGMVAVRAADEEILLTADQKVHFNKKAEQLVKAKENAQSSVKMWKKRNISFEDKPLIDIVTLLEKNFNVQIVFQDKTLEDYTLTADFNELNLISIMEIVSQSLNLQYEISGDRIRLIKNK